MGIRGAIVMAAAAAMLPFVAQGSAEAADLRGRAPVAAAEPQLCKETSEVNPDIFGFSSGSDVATPGSLALGIEYGGGFGTRTGRSMSTDGKVQLSYGLVPCVEIGPSVVFGHSYDEPYGFEERGESDAIGGAIEAKFKLLGRAQTGFGMTLVFEPSWVRVNESTRFADGSPTFENDHDETGLASKIVMDAVLVPDRLFFALNFIHEAAWIDVTPQEEESAFINSAALTLKATEAFYIGVEGSYRQAYAGAWFDKSRGDAWYVGPTFFWALSENVSLSAPWRSRSRVARRPSSRMTSSPWATSTSWTSASTTPS
ncbi:MAG: hypothetical protein HC829_01520 [Bacteroidales bacterium]|nr:hypothetical protein [Bacteroidales bacterium]